MKPTALLALLPILVLAACGEGGGGVDSSSPANGPTPAMTNPGMQSVGIPNLDGRKARLQLVDLPEQDFPQVDVPAQGAIRITVPVTLEQRLFRVSLMPPDAQVAQDQAAMNTTIDTSGGTQPAQALLLVLGKQLNQGMAGFNPLTDYISRRMNDYTTTQTDERIAYFMDGLAGEFIREDLDGDGTVSFADAARFDPTNPQHLQALSFDYGQRVTTPLSSGRTLLQTYAEAPAETGAALLEAFESVEGYALPGPHVSIVTVLSADVDKGGSVTIDQIPDVRLQADNSRLLQRNLRVPTARSYRLRAAPDAGWRFVRWVGCDRVEADASCTMQMDDDKQVGAQFGLDRNLLAPGIAGVLKLADHAGQRFMLTMPTQGMVQFTGVQPGALANALGRVTVDHVLATGDREHPTLRITQVPPGPATAADGSLAFTFSVVDVSYLDVYQALSTFDDETPITIDDVVSAKLSLGDEVTRSNANGMAAKAGAAAPAAPPLWVLGLGRAVDVGHGHLLVNNPSGRGLALLKTDERAKLHSVPADKVLGKLSERCAQDRAAPECSVIAGAPGAADALPGKAGGCVILAAGCNIVVTEVRLTRNGTSKAGGQFVGAFKIEANLDIDYHQSMSYMWSIAPPGLDLAYNGRGLLTLTAGAGLFVGLDGEFDAKKSIDLYERKSGSDTGKKTSVDVTGDFNGADHNQTGRVRSGKLDRAAAVAATLAAQGTQSAPAAATPAPEPDVAVRVEMTRNTQAAEVTNPAASLAIQLNRSTPDGAVAPLKLSFGFGVKGKGKLGLDSSATVVLRNPFEVDVDVGSRCRKVSLLVTDATVCDGWKSPQRFEMVSNLKMYSKLSTKVVANAEAGPYMEVALTWGPGGLKEDLVKIQASAAAIASLVGGAELWSHSNLPEDKADAAGLPSGCSRSLQPLAFAMDAVLEASGKVDAAIERSFFGKRVSMKFFETDIFKYDSRIPIIEPQLMFKDLAASTTSDACLPVMKRPARLMPDEIVWKPGELKWDEPNFVVTKNRRLALQLDGNFVLYKLNRSDGGRGGIGSESALDWKDRKQADTYPGTTLEFQQDGNLVLYSVRGRPLWASNTSVRKEDAGNMRLKLQSDGNLVIYNGSSVRWATNTNSQ